MILDVRMPKMSGIELQTQLANEERRVPIIFITAFPDEAVRSRALDAGAAAFLTKPFDGKSMLRCLSAELAQNDRWN